ncbi:MAG: choice-of-anchor J domain-containing protein [Flavobacterium sp.]
MKKLLLLLLLASNFLFSQTLFQENFDALGSPITLPTGWTMTNLSNPIGTATWFRGNTASFSSYNGPADGYIAVNYQSGAGVSDLNNWLMSPVITVQNGDQVSFYTRVPGSQYPDRLELRMSTSGASSTNPVGVGVGSYTTLCASVNANLAVDGYPTTWTKITYTVTGLTGQVGCKFALRYNVEGGGTGNNSDYVGVDAFQVKRPVLNDISIESVAVPAIIVGGNFTFNGIVKNQGTNAVTSYIVNWQANSGTVNPYTVTGVNIAPGGTHNFTHNVALNAVVGSTYALSFTVPTVNTQVDGNTGDNTMTMNTQVAAGTTSFKPLLEKFTSSTCSPCASYNASTFNPYFTAQNQTFNYIAYQMNWPGSGDPYYTAEGGVRRGYYGVNAITSLWIDGVEYSTSNNQATLTSYVNNEATKPGYFGLTANRNLSGGNAVVNYTITPYLSGSFVLHAAVIEKLTTANVGSNGETSFKHVMMKMVPNASGTTISTTAGTPISGQISASLAGTNIEENSDLEVIVFIQNATTREIMQSFKATDALSLEDNVLAKVKLYPNPATNNIRFTNIQEATILITDVTGKVVLQTEGVDENSIINVSNLNSGIYLVNIKNESMNETIKFVKK